MDKDLKIYMDDSKFKVRVASIIISDNHLLVEKYGEDSFMLPGGHVEINETSKQAIKRELKEELSMDIEVDKFIGLIENFFINIKNEKTHCLDFFYKCSIKVDNYNDIETDEIDHGEHKHHIYKWLKVDELESYNLKPECIINIIKTGDFKQLFHIVNSDK